MVEFITIVLWTTVVFGSYKILAFFGALFHRIFAGILPRNFLNEYGKNSWAVVTGASDGIGEVFCKELAKLGFNVCLVSRTKSKLDCVEESLKKINPNIQTKIITADLSHSVSSPTMYDYIYEELKGLDVSFLINSAGVYYVGMFEEIE
jgi:17beta-estradiol 17-dehydrogenase / very-long-chain 3-oxoacyl-CoA reductase